MGAGLQDWVLDLDRTGAGPGAGLGFRLEMVRGPKRCRSLASSLSAPASGFSSCSKPPHDSFGAWRHARANPDT